MSAALPPALVAEIEATFRAEAADRLREMYAVHETSDDRPHELSSLLRHAHSIKGAAAAVGRTDIAELAHAFETRLEAARDEVDELDDPQVEAMLDELANAIDPAPDVEASASELVERTEDAGAPSPGEAGATTAAAAADPSPSPPVARGENAATELVRVGASALDRVTADVGDLALTTDEWRRVAAAMRQLAKRLGARAHSISGGSEQPVSAELAALSRRVREQTHRTERLLESVDQQLHAIRMESVDTLLAAAAREARRLARHLDHRVEVTIHGAEVLADRRVIGRLHDPLLHLVRNAVDHGVDDGEDRRRRGKPEALSVRIVAEVRGNTLVIEVADDGRGIDLDRIREGAVRRGVDVAHLDDAGLQGLVFAAGVSTAGHVTDVSGRGVGLTAVREEVEALYGSVGVDSTPGVGTTFRLEVPQGVAGVRCLVATIGDGQVAVPAANILTLRSFRETPPHPVGGRAALVVDGVARLVVSGASLVAEHADADARYGVVIEHAGRTCALAVDDLVAQLDLVVKPLPAILGIVEGVAGGAVLGDGTVVPVLQPSSLVDLDASTPGKGGAGTEAEEEAPRLLLVDDSATTRTLIRTILVAAGFRVTSAVDGTEGLRVLREEPHDLVVSDIEMPGLDGFALTRAIRAAPSLAATPVVLVSSRAGDADRAESAAAGADVHLDKGAFDQGQLVTAIRELLG